MVVGTSAAPAGTPPRVAVRDNQHTWSVITRNAEEPDGGPRPSHLAGRVDYTRWRARALPVSRPSSWRRPRANAST